MADPEGKPGRLLAIGDVHGCTVQLDALWKAAPTPQDIVVFLGDYVDRGPDSQGVVDRLIEWRRTHSLILLRGNHELMMQRSKDHPSEQKIWMQVGGADCLASYSPHPGRMGKLDDVPEEHWQFLCSLEDYHAEGRCLFIHANLNPDKPIDEQDEEELFWKPMTEPVCLPDRIVICGHTSQKSGAIRDWGTTICIDTHAFGGGMLTALDCTSWHFWQANLLGRISEGDLPTR